MNRKVFKNLNRKLVLLNHTFYNLILVLYLDMYCDTIIVI